MRKVHNWDEWIDYFRFWQDSIGLDRDELRQAVVSRQKVPARS